MEVSTGHKKRGVRKTEPGASEGGRRPTGGSPAAFVLRKRATPTVIVRPAATPQASHRTSPQRGHAARTTYNSNEVAAMHTRIRLATALALLATLGALSSASASTALASTAPPPQSDCS